MKLDNIEVVFFLVGIIGASIFVYFMFFQPITSVPNGNEYDLTASLGGVINPFIGAIDQLYYKGVSDGSLVLQGVGYSNYYYAPFQNGMTVQIKGYKYYMTDITLNANNSISYRLHT